MKPNIKKLLILNAPYLLFVYLFDKVGQAVRLSPGADLSGKLLSIGSGFSAAFSNALPSFAPMDLLIGIVGAVVIRLAVYVKGKNAKKYRKGMEYGSARWGNAEDIKPYIDPIFENNVLLTQTERLMMSSRPKHPKYTQNRLAEDLRDNEQQVMTIELAKALVEREKDGQEISLSAQQVANVLRPQKAKKTANTPEQKTRGFKLEIELFADFLPESITKKEAIERITEALRQFNEYSGATTGRT